MLYQSHYSDLQVLVRSEAVIYHPATGVETNRIPALTANFGTHGKEFQALNPLTGEMEMRSDIRGHFFDTEAAAERLGWTPEEQESVISVLDRLCLEQPFMIAKVVHEVVVAQPPWPTYEETHHKTIPVLAQQLGLVQETLAYERENRNREGIISALTEAQDSVPEMITLE
jgi:hypothetical protein